MDDPKADHRPSGRERFGYSPAISVGARLTVMETRTAETSAPLAPGPAATPAEELPGLYRTILERVAELEQRGERSEAAQIRMSATAAYSAAWDESGRNRLLSLVHRADRAIDGTSRPRGFALRRRSLPAR
jgi:hypothetical protein